MIISLHCFEIPSKGQESKVQQDEDFKPPHLLLLLPLTKADNY